LGERRPTQLSGGQQQRVALARALIFDPDVVLMDEPLGSLDKQLREHLQIEIKHIQQSLGLTVAYVTHDQSEALTMSDRIAVFDQGAIQQLATPEELYEQPQNAFVAQFIGESNRLVGTVRELRDHHCLVEVEGGIHVHALPVKVELGARTTLSIRPERVLVRPTPGSCETVLPAQIEELIYHGDHRRVRLRLLNGGDFLIKVPNAEHEKVLGPGELIDIGWRTRDCRALDAP
jgi:putative spermidine/putrescine transport system ATP-binding protein